MRQFSYTTTAGGTIMLGGHDYIIETANGMSEPKLINQEQKAPFQDGTTYIDTLLDVREITITGAINIPGCSPTALTGINAAKDTMMRALNPKNGQGWLTYTYNGGSKKIQAIPSIVFSNKLSTNAYQRFQIVFRCNDPMWQSVFTSSISLPTPVTSVESSINAAQTFYPEITQKSNSNLVMVYTILPDGYLVSREYNGTSWSAESSVNPSFTHYPSVTQKSNGNLLVVYQRMSDGYLVSREFTTSWSAESVINAAASTDVCVIQKLNSNIFVVYKRTSDLYLVSREYNGTSWSAETLINTVDSYNPSVLQKNDGNLILSYSIAPYDHLVVREYNGTSWSTETVINAASSSYPSVTQKNDGNLFIIYKRTADDYIVSREFTNVWGSESVMAYAPSYYVTCIKKTNGNIFMAYTRFSDRYLVSAERSVTPINAAITGHVSVPVVITFNGPSTNPRIVKQSTLETIRINKVLAVGDTFTINTSFGKKSIDLYTDGMHVNGMAYLDQQSTFFKLDLGNNTVYYEDDIEGSTATAVMAWNERYIGA